MLTKPIRYGIAGCGMISGTHARAIRHTDAGQLVSVFSRNREKAEQFGREHEAEAFTDYESFLANPELDVVVICTPTGSHLNYGKPAARAGKHVVVEKPIEINTKRGQELLDVCRANGVKITVIYQNRFIDDVAVMKKAVDDGVLGRLVMVTASVKWFRDDAYYRDAPWRGTHQLDGGGAVINQAVHTVDLLQWIAGDIHEISAFKATLTHEGIEGEDNAVACFRLSDGALGVFQASTSIRPPQNRKIELHGTLGTALLDGDQLVVRDKEGREVSANELSGNAESGLDKSVAENSDAEKPGTEKPGGDPAAVKPDTEKPDDGQTGDRSGHKQGAAPATGAASPMSGLKFENHYRQYETINESLLYGKEMAVTGEESLKSLGIIEALYQSADM